MTNPTYSAIYSFGDSLSDAGDAYLLTATYGAALGSPTEPVSPPYYQESYTAAGGGTLAADVFSNGPVWVQDLASALGLTTVAPGQIGLSANALLAVLSANVPPGTAQNLVNLLEVEQGTFGQTNPYVQLVAGAQGGTDFAIGGSVTGPTGSNTGSATLTDLQTQLADFENEYPTPAANALYTVWSGANDLLDLLESSQFATNTVATDDADIGQSAANVVTMVEQLMAGAGAQTILVGNVPDLGLTPVITALAGTDPALPAIATGLTTLFNADLAADLAVAKTESLLGTATVDIVPVDNLISTATVGTVVQTPGGPVTLGNVTQSAYTGSYSADNGTVASNPDTYLFWDGLHPTGTAHQDVANLALGVLAGTVACYCAGTLIRTPGGDVPVEALQPGDQILTAAGAVRPVRWVGHRRYAGRFLRANPAVLPVCFAPGSLADGVPSRALYVSPEHAMAIDGFLVPARDLVNGVTIRPVAVDEVTYHHVELDSHDILLAEGAPAESYVDDDSRGVFHNAPAYWRTHPNEAAAPVRFCAPRLTSGQPLETIRHRLAARMARAA